MRHDTDQDCLYFADGQPDSHQTLVFFPALLDIARREAKRVVVLSWDNASWHKSKSVRQWIRAYNQRVKREGDARLLVLRLPTKSPWLNPIELRWVHAKRYVCEPADDLTACELQRRLYCYFATEPIIDCAQDFPEARSFRNMVKSKSPGD